MAEMLRPGIDRDLIVRDSAGDFSRMSEPVRKLFEAWQAEEDFDAALPMDLPPEEEQAIYARRRAFNGAIAAYQPQSQPAHQDPPACSMTGACSAWVSMVLMLRPSPCAG